MKMYSVDRSWRGGIVVIADTRKEAFFMVKNIDQHIELDDENDPMLEEHDLVIGSTIEFYGDS
ncbi:hypothetical protein UFOVP1290_183 [uncultured Caudovirales phage]|uniref:Uncharacterized protein n=1 Tax=uncultured Caudovirales phage TaxID=2100421 RepID=A0A6J5RH27_9CAUD|nr:hypothetical protein UFOVP1290_183 [uncultured Caudovirales phage]